MISGGNIRSVFGLALLAGGGAFGCDGVTREDLRDAEDRTRDAVRSEVSSSEEHLRERLRRLEERIRGNEICFGMVEDRLRRLEEGQGSAVTGSQGLQEPTGEEPDSASAKTLVAEFEPVWKEEEAKEAPKEPKPVSMSPSHRKCVSVGPINDVIPPETVQFHYQPVQKLDFEGSAPIHVNCLSVAVTTPQVGRPVRPFRLNIEVPGNRPLVPLLNYRPMARKRHLEKGQNQVFEEEIWNAPEDEAFRILVDMRVARGTATAPADIPLIVGAYAITQ